jgi:UTP--glucose-1-phosphate uridylyltransferase
MKTAVITTGGLGTRLLTCTKSSTKIMLPLYDMPFDDNLGPLLKPLVEIIFNNLYENGFRKFCFIMSNSKSVLIDHMTPEKYYISILEKRGLLDDKRFAKHLRILYKKIENSEFNWVIQNEPLGFGDAVLKAKKIVGKNDFLLHTGDAYFPNYDFLKKFIKKHENEKNDSTLLLQKLNSVKGYGIAEMKKGKEGIVLRAKEKPKTPFSNTAILPLYCFNSKIFDVLSNTPNGYNNELQLTDAIQFLIRNKSQVRGMNFGKMKWFDVGTPESYFNAINYSYKSSKL